LVSVEGAVVPRTRVKFAKLSVAELAQIKRFIEDEDVNEISDELYALVERYWPWLLERARYHHHRSHVVPPHCGLSFNRTLRLPAW
jgi:hypothetical protein